MNISISVDCFGYSLEVYNLELIMIMITKVLRGYFAIDSFVIVFTVTFRWLSELNGYCCMFEIWFLLDTVILQD